MTALMRDSEELPEEYEVIIDGYEPTDDELEVDRSWQPPPPWTEYAACGDSPMPNAWYPEQGKGNSYEVRAARRICGRCLVRTECLNLALSRGEPHGMWGGMTPEERQVEKARRAGRIAVYLVA